MNRRHFIGKSALVLAACAAPAAFGAAGSRSGRPRLVFTKTMEELSFDELSEHVSALGVSGLEAPIRSGGHIDPKNVAEKLPLMVEALKKRNLELMILSSDINHVDREGKAEALLRVAAEQGITQYRLAHFKYDLAKPIAPQLAEVRAKMLDLAAMNRELGVQGQYQNHRGNNYVGGPIWDMVEALEGIDPAQLGMAFDFAHATVEGANAWELNFRRAAPHVVAVYFKDYKLDGRRWNACPLGEGVVNPNAGKLVDELLPESTPVSLHVEYIGGSGDERVRKTLEAMKNDLATLEKWLPVG